MPKHLMPNHKPISIKNNRILLGKGSMLKIHRHALFDMPVFENGVRENENGNKKMSNTNLDKLRQSLSNMSLNASAKKKYINF